MSNEGKSRQNFTTIRQSYRKYKVIVVGETGVGKTSLTRRLCEGTFPKHVEHTIAVDFSTCTINIDGEDMTLLLWDTVGQERFHSLIRGYYAKADAAILVYDITCLATFNKIGVWMEECSTHCPEGIPRILIGNKSDGEPQVTTKMAQGFANQFSMPLFLTSAKENSEDNIEVAFLTLGRLLKNREPPQKTLWDHNADMSRDPKKSRFEDMRSLHDGKEPGKRCYC